MKRSHIAFVVGLLFLLTPLRAHTQSVDKITAAGGWNLTVDVATANAPLTLAVDGAAAVPAAGVVWTGTTAKIPLSQMPAAASAVGVHTVVVTDPGLSVTLADLSLFQVGGGSLTVSYEVVSSTPNPPKNPHWLRIAGTVALAFVSLALAIGWL